MKTIPLSKRGKHKDMYFAIVDDVDYDALMKYNWGVCKNGRNMYAIRTDISSGKRKTTQMHRDILGVSDANIIIDHKDHDGLNNQRSNLRECTKEENSRNRIPRKNASSSYLGVSIQTNKNGYTFWRAKITHNKKKINIGSYKTEKEAAVAYNDMAVKLHKEFANINTII